MDLICKFAEIFFHPFRMVVFVRAGFPGRGEGAELAGLLACVPRAVHRRLADQARVLPTLQEEALDAPTRHGCMLACCELIDVPCVTLPRMRRGAGGGRD
jgi:hypothetical protein